MLLLLASGLLLAHFLSSTVAAVSGVAPTPLVLAFGAGVLAVFNPCGFALLPAFISYTVGGSGSGSARTEVASVDHGARGAYGEPGAQPLLQRLLRGTLVGLPLTASFLLVFLIAGGALAAGGRALAGIFPWLGLVVGLVLVAMGARLLLTGTAIDVPIFPTFVRVGAWISAARKRRGKSHVLPGECCADEPASGDRLTTSDVAERAAHPLRAAWGFGIGYGLSSLGCTLPVFLLVVGSAVAAGGFGQAVLVLTAVGVGMAVVLLGVALVATTLGHLLRQSMLPLLRWVQPVAALLVLAAGIYIVVYQVRAGLVIH